MEIRVIEESNEKDINIPNHPFALRGRLIVTYSGTEWEYRVVRYPAEQITEMTFPDENYVYSEMKDCVFLGAYEGNVCVGLAILSLSYGPCLYLSDLKVNREWRGKGVGRKLIDAAMTVAAEKKCTGLLAIAQDNNLDACLFYLGCGFEIGGLDTAIYQGTKQEGKSDINFYKR